MGGTVMGEARPVKFWVACWWTVCLGLAIGSKFPGLLEVLEGGLSGGETLGEVLGERFGEGGGVGGGVDNGVESKLGKREKDEEATWGPWPNWDDDCLTGGGGPCERRCGIHYKQKPEHKKSRQKLLRLKMKTKDTKQNKTRSTYLSLKSIKANERDCQESPTTTPKTWCVLNRL